MKLRLLLRWMLFVTLIAAVAVGGALHLVRSRSDSYVAEQLQARFSEAAPELRLILGETRIHGLEGVILSDVEIRERRSDSPIFRCRQIRVAVDPTALTERGNVVVRNVMLADPAILLSRGPDGRWNWQDYELRLKSRSEQGLPKIEAQRLAVQLELSHGSALPATRLVLRDCSVSMIPSSHDSCSIDCQVPLPGAGILNLSGAADRHRKTWQISGALDGIQADQKLLQLVESVDPSVGSRLAELDGRLKQIATLTREESFASAEPTTPSEAAVRLAGKLDVRFKAAGNAEAGRPDFEIGIQLHDGHLASRLLPDALTDIRAEATHTNSGTTFRLHQARSGNGVLSAQFDAATDSGDLPELRFRCDHFDVDSRLRPLMPAAGKRVFDHFRPTAVVSASGLAKCSADGTWLFRDLGVVVHEGTAEFHKFRMPLSRLEGKLTQVDDNDDSEGIRLAIEMQGFAGSRPFKASGWTRNPGPNAELRVRMAMTDVPLDSTFRDALDPNSRKVVDSMQLRGSLSGTVDFYRPPGAMQPTSMLAEGEISEGRIRFVHFPYDINDISGHVVWNSAKKHWAFSRLQGQHGEAVITAEGTFKGDPSPGVLDLSVRTANGRLDSDLYNALQAGQRSVWDLLRPSGRLDMDSDIHWTAAPGQRAVVRFPRIRVTNGSMRPRPFPFDSRIESLELSFDPNDARFAGVQHCEIVSMRLTHDGIPMAATGWTEIKPDGEWQVHLNDLTTGNLRPDDNLRAALPDSWHPALTRLHQSGYVAVEDSELDFRGIADSPSNTTAAWNMSLRVTDCRLDAGLLVEDITGLVTARGTWDGQHLENQGDIRLDTANTLEMPFTRIVGPYTLNDTELVLGNSQVFQSGTTEGSPPESRVRAQAYGGRVLLDAVVGTLPDQAYRLFTEVQGARLEDYAGLHIPDQRNLRGVINAWMALRGEGDSDSNLVGRGALQISPAAIYDLPVMVKMFAALIQLKFNVQGTTAFDYAGTDFRIKDRAFILEPIDLVGESVSLRGRGRVGFGGDVLLDFYSRPARPGPLSIPVFGSLLTQWTKVEVRGTTERPQVMTRTIGQAEESLQQFLRAFEPRPGAPPVFRVPRTFITPGVARRNETQGNQ